MPFLLPRMLKRFDPDSACEQVTANKKGTQNASLFQFSDLKTYLKRRLRVAKSFKRRALSWIKPAASF